MLADHVHLAEIFHTDRTAATTPVGELPPLNALLRRSTGTPTTACTTRSPTAAA